MARTFRITESLKTNEDGARLLTVTVSVLTGDGDPNVFLVRQLSPTDENDAELIDICSYADIEAYGTVASADEMYRAATATVGFSTEAKYTAVRADILADLQLILDYQIASEANPDAELIEYNDTSAAMGPFAFSDPGELAGKEPEEHLAEFTITTTGASEDFKVQIAAPAALLINWGDSSDEVVSTAGITTHEYATAGTYQITLLSGTCTRFAFGADGCTPAPLQSVDAVVSADLGLTSALEMFKDCVNLDTFEEEWFDAASADITNISSMFSGAAGADPDVSGWDTSLVTDMSYMFYGCSIADPDVSGFVTTNVTNMAGMFLDAAVAEPDVSGFDTSKVTSMASMFEGAALADPDVSGWDTSLVTDMSSMFEGAASADPDISGFVVTALTTATDMMLGSVFSKANYDLMLVAWEAQDVNDGVVFHAGTTMYGFGVPAAARQALIDDHSWTFTDGGVQIFAQFTVETSGASEDFKVQIDAPSSLCIDWGDDNQSTVAVEGITTHTYVTADTYQITLCSGTCTRFAFGEVGCTPTLLKSVDAVISVGLGLTSAENMFAGCTALDTFEAGWFAVASANITSMVNMFSGATIADPDISGFDVTALTDASGMMEDSAFAKANYNLMLVAWEAQDVLDGVSFHAGTAKYDVGAPANARQALIDDHSWSFTDGGTDYLASFTIETVGSPEDFKVQIDAPASLVIDWGDDSQSTVTVAGITAHAYASAGEYQITLLSGTCTRFAFGGTGTTPTLLKSVDSVISGDIGLTTGYQMFYGCSNLSYFALGWFDAASANITSMVNMFSGATIADPDTSGWDTALVTNMSRMFEGASSANPDTSGWDTSLVTDMQVMFYLATSADPDTSNWDTSAVTNMSLMFYGATSADPDTSGWDTSAVTDMSYMFYGATSADPDISGFDVTALTTAANMFTGSSFSQVNYDAMLVAWEAQAVLDNVPFHAGDATYGEGAPATAKQALIDDHNWSFTDGGASLGRFTIVTATSPENFSVYVTGASSLKIAWGDGSDTTVSGSTVATHSYATAGTYSMILLSGTTTALRFNITHPQLRSVDSVISPDLGLTTTQLMFSQCSALSYFVPGWFDEASANVENMSYMFYSAVVAEPDTSGWDTSKVTSMAYMFYSAVVAEPDTSGWDTALVSDMRSMFQSAANAAPDTSGWDTAKVTNMGRMFESASKANPDTSGWDTALVTQMFYMFSKAYVATPDTSGWDTAKVTSMEQMFRNAHLANPDVSGWDTSLVTSTQYMFYSAVAADPDLSGFTVTALTTAYGMMQLSAFSQAHYDAMLVAWEAQAVLDNVPFHAGSAKYGAGAPATAKQDLIDDHSWSFTDGGAA